MSVAAVILSIVGVYHRVMHFIIAIQTDQNSLIFLNLLFNYIIPNLVD